MLINNINVCSSKRWHVVILHCFHKIRIPQMELFSITNLTSKKMENYILCWWPDDLGTFLNQSVGIISWGIFLAGSKKCLPHIHGHKFSLPGTWNWDKDIVVQFGIISGMGNVQTLRNFGSPTLPFGQCMRDSRFTDRKKS